MRPDVRASCEAAVADGRWSDLRDICEPARVSALPGDPAPNFFASYYLPRREAVAALLASMVANPTFRPSARRLADLLDPEPALRDELDAGRVPDRLMGEAYPDDFEGEVAWRTAPPEPGFALPEPLGDLHRTYPIAVGERIEPMRLRATIVEDGWAYWDGAHFQPFRGDQPLRTGPDMPNGRLVAAAARAIMDRGGAIDVPEPVHVVGAPGPRSFYHWMIDIVPLVDAMRDLFPDVAVRTIVTNSTGLDFQEASLGLAAPGARVQEIRGPTVVRAPRIVYASHRNGLGHGVPSRTVEFWRAHDTAPRPRHRRIYVARAEGSGRALVPAARAEAIARERGFTAVRMEELPLREQFAVFAGADVVAGVHGAGLTHAMFMRPRSVLVEVFGDHMTSSFRYLAGRVGAHYLPVAMPGAFADVSSRTLRERDATRFADVTLDPDRLANALDLAVAIAARGGGD